MKDEEQIIDEVRKAKERGVFPYCLVASGRGPTENHRCYMRTSRTRGFLYPNPLETTKDAVFDVWIATPNATYIEQTLAECVGVQHRMQIVGVVKMRVNALHKLKRKTVR